MPEEEAFCLLVRLMNQYKLRDLFVQDILGNTQVTLNVNNAIAQQGPSPYRGIEVLKSACLLFRQ